MPEYRVLRGTHRTEDGNRAEAGETVELSEDQRDRLPDGKFEPVEQSASETEESESESGTSADEADTEESPDGEDDVSDTSDDTSESEEEDEEPDAATDTDVTEAVEEVDDEVQVEDLIPYDNYRLLSRMAADYDGEEIHGAMGGDEIAEHLETLTVPEVQELKRLAEAELSGDD